MSKQGEEYNAKKLVLEIRDTFCVQDCIFGVIYANKTFDNVSARSSERDSKAKNAVRPEDTDKTTK